MKTTLLLVGQNPEAFAVVKTALELFSADAELLPLATLEDALQRPPAQKELLVLVEPADAQVVRAGKAVDGIGLPRWAVVALGGAGQTDTESLPRAEWTPAALARSFRTALTLHELARENARLRGDLRTIARRVTHDVRSPLNGIVTACAVLKEMLAADAPDDVEMLEPIMDSADEITRLVEQVGFLAKVTTDASPMETVPMDEIVWKALARLEATIKERKAVVTHAATWPQICGAPALLEMIWANLVANSLRHGSQPAQVALGWDERENEHCFWVEDNGPGVPAARQASLFGPFHRLHEPNASRGLGLSVVQRLVELQGGSCGYETRAEGGARFYFTLPR